MFWTCYDVMFLVSLFKFLAFITMYIWTFIFFLSSILTRLDHMEKARINF